MSTPTKAVPAHESVAPHRLVRAALIAAVVASVANLLVYVLVPALFDVSLAVPMGGPGSDVQPLPAFMVIIATVVPIIGATLLLEGLNRFTARPVTIFRVVAVVFLLVSFIAPFSLPVPLGVKLTLASMHVIAAAVITYVLTTQARAA